MSIVCEEVFDDISHPSEEEIRDYATKIGIDPDSEPQLLPLAAEGLMKALPPGWKPCYDDKSKSYYYYNNLTKNTQWEHPLDEIYRGLVKKARTDSQSLSLQEKDAKEDATYVTDDILSLDEPVVIVAPKKLDPLQLGARKKDIRLSPLKLSPSASPKKELKLFKQRSEDFSVGPKRLSLGFSSFDENKDGSFSRHPRSLDRNELKVSGGGSMFLKSNTVRKSSDAGLSSSLPKNDSSQESQVPRSILREKNTMEHSKSLEFDKLLVDKSEKDDEDKKSVRFNLDNTTDVGITFSDKSSSDEDIHSDKNKIDNIIDVKLTPTMTRFSVSPVLEPVKHPNSLKIIKPNPKDFIKPKLTLNKSSDSDEETRSIEKPGIDAVDTLFDTENSDSSPSDKLSGKLKKLEEQAERKVTQLKQSIWEEKNEEMVKFKSDLEDSNKEELKRILDDEKLKQKDITKMELEKIKVALEEERETLLKEEQENLLKSLDIYKEQLENGLEEDEQKMKKQFETKKEELEKYYDEKLADIEKELAEKVEKSRDELIFTHKADIEQLKQNHSIIIEELKREFQAEDQTLKKDHQAKLTELKKKHKTELDQEKSKTLCDERMFEKLRCEKRLLEDKYRCLKEKYLKLKTEVKLSIEKKNRRKEQSTTTNTTGSETEQSNSNKERIFVEKPPTPKHTKSNNEGTLNKSDNKTVKQVVIQDLDTSVSDNCYHSDDKTNQNDKDSSDSTNPGRSRRKLFSRLKSSSTSRINNNSKTRKPQRSCSPVENLRRQLQKLEDLEDQFPENAQSDTYHLRYPFSDGQKFEGSSELEFFRHRIHLERDSIKRAKESLRSQKSLFQQRQKELKLKHGTMARHTLQQLCQGCSQICPGDELFDENFVFKKAHH
ncbi:unnamed protein product [Phaedon cochleariae]|uniref:WW domain-containing protein n=1 Tax=Phaedon cochleariae TaxID=80249 RepID=A0A9P0DIH2_PHACE|nr:unnamed protein product [Phaedon cochleariae]